MEETSSKPPCFALLCKSSQVGKGSVYPSGYYDRLVSAGPQGGQWEIHYPTAGGGRRTDCRCKPRPGASSKPAPASKKLPNLPPHLRVRLFHCLLLYVLFFSAPRVTSGSRHARTHSDTLTAFCHEVFHREVISSKPRRPGPRSVAGEPRGF